MAHGSPLQGAHSPTPLPSLVNRVVEAWLDDFDLSEQSIRRMIDVSGRFVSFIEGGGGAAEVLALDCEKFVKALVPGGSGARHPAIATMHLRRATLRLLFRTARDLGVHDGDPTLDIALPPRSSLKVRV